MQILRYSCDLVILYRQPADFDVPDSVFSPSCVGRNGGLALKSLWICQSLRAILPDFSNFADNLAKTAGSAAAGSACRLGIQRL
jgi:hypothetical protein